MRWCRKYKLESVLSDEAMNQYNSLSVPALLAGLQTQTISSKLESEECERSKLQVLSGANSRILKTNDLSRLNRLLTWSQLPLNEPRNIFGEPMPVLCSRSSNGFKRYCYPQWRSRERGFAHAAEISSNFQSSSSYQISLEEIGVINLFDEFSELSNIIIKQCLGKQGIISIIN